MAIIIIQDPLKRLPFTAVNTLVDGNSKYTIPARSFAVALVVKPDIDCIISCGYEPFTKELEMDAPILAGQLHSIIINRSFEVATPIYIDGIQDSDAIFTLITISI